MKKALFVSFKEPTGISIGGTHGNERNLMLMQDVFGKSNVNTFYVHKKNEIQTTWLRIRNALGFIKGLHNGLTYGKIKYICSISSQYDLIFLDTSLFGIIAKRLKECSYRGTVVSYFHNVEEIYYEARVPKHLPGRQLIIHCAAKNDEWTCRYANITIALNQRDKTLLEQKYNRKIDYLIPVSFKDEFHRSTSEGLTSYHPLLTFIGSYFGPNRDGLLWFVKNVMPHVNIQLKIVGKDMDKMRKFLSNKTDINIFSNIPDIKPYIEEADFMLMPIFSGSGMKVKTCEALMYGKNIIGTNEAFEGYDIDTSKVGACCNTAEEFINAINAFCKKPIAKFNAYSRKSFLEKYSYDVILKKAKQIFQ